MPEFQLRDGNTAAALHMNLAIKSDEALELASTVHSQELRQRIVNCIQSECQAILEDLRKAVTGIAASSSRPYEEVWHTADLSPEHLFFIRGGIQHLFINACMRKQRRHIIEHPETVFLPQ